MDSPCETIERPSRSVARLRILVAAMLGASLLCLPLIAGPVGYETLLRPYWPRNAHQSYGHGLIKSSLIGTPAGRRWLSAAETAVHDPTPVELPLTIEAAALDADVGALGYRFSVASGRRLRIEVTGAEDAGIPMFVDLFEGGSAGVRYLSSAVASEDRGSADGNRTLDWHVLDDSDLILRVQPGLAATADLGIRIAAEPLLAFPVQGHGIRAIQSGFGADRDGGRRAHRGVDIFADRGTEALAAMDAWVARVDTTPRGGNVVWLQSLFGNLRLYYAHLDSRLVEEGDLVLAGDVVGTVGNTGNAVTTPPHLHFGVYMRRRGMRGGARDPYDFLR